jgi:hypothetical protein
VASRWLREHGARSLEATYLPTKKNAPVHEFLVGSQLGRDESKVQFSWNLQEGVYPLPASINLEWAAMGAEPAEAR